MHNKAQLIGRVGKDPEIREVSDTKLATFSLATSKKIKGEEVTQWHNCKAWGKLAEVIESYIKKGSTLFVEGEIQYRQHEGKYYTDIVIGSLTMLDKKESSGQPAPKAEKPSISTPPAPEDNDLPF